MHRLLPTVALTPSTTPPLGASDAQLIRFAQTLNGYEDCGGHNELAAAVHAMPGLHAATLHQLRLKLFQTQRKHYMQGGSWGPEDPLMASMREISALIRTRVVEQQSALLSWTGDITRLSVDAIVNAAKPTLTGGGGVDGAIHRAAGPQLLQACLDLPANHSGVRCPPGEAQLTPGFDLPAKYVLHTVGPRWAGGQHGEDAQLEQAYTSCITLAFERRFQSIAFPAISTGTYGFPRQRAARISTDTVHRLLSRSSHTLRVVFVAFAD